MKPNVLRNENEKNTRLALKMRQDVLQKAVDTQLESRADIELAERYCRIHDEMNAPLLEFCEAAYVKSVSEAMNYAESQRPQLDDYFYPMPVFDEIPCERVNLHEVEVTLRDFLTINLNSLKHYFNKIVCEQFAVNTVVEEHQVSITDAMNCAVTIKPLMTHSYRMMTECETHLRCAVYFTKSREMPVLLDMTINDYEVAVLFSQNYKLPVWRDASDLAA